MHNVENFSSTAIVFYSIHAEFNILSVQGMKPSPESRQMITSKVVKDRVGKWAARFRQGE